MAPADAPVFADGPYEPVLKAPIQLEGSDLSLATEILPPPPPLAFIRLNRKPGELGKASLPSFLPSTDPGSTYATFNHGYPPSMVMAGSSEQDVHGRRKRARIDKSLPNRIQQRPTVQLNIPQHAPEVSIDSAQLPEPIAGSSAPPDGRHPVDTLPAEPISNGGTPTPTSVPIAPAKRGRGRPRKIKTESPGQIPTDLQPDLPKEVPRELPFVCIFCRIPHHSRADDRPRQRNDDICACCSISHSNSNASPLSHFLYCDSCTRSFHMGCLDPPVVDKDDQPPPDHEWFCPACLAEKNPPQMPRDGGLFDHLIHQQQISVPRVFQLPEEIRTYFKDVSVGRQGAYLDSGETKTGKANRHGFLEDRDPYRLKDRNNKYITCYKCTRSAAPRYSIGPIGASESSVRQPRKAKAAAEAAIQSSQTIISCDYCNLHWHLDCLDPPLAVMPPPLKKWMCPNHIDHVMPHRRNIKNPKIVEVKTRGTRNNGIIEIIPSAEDMTSAQGTLYDEVWINAKKYMIPERMIRLDFLDKAADHRDPGRRKPSRHPSPQPPGPVPDFWSSSSPLTSLSSLSDDDEQQLAGEDVEMENVSSAVSSSRVSSSQPHNPTWREMLQAVLDQHTGNVPVANGHPTSPTIPAHVKAGSTATSFRIRLGVSRPSAPSPAKKPVDGFGTPNGSEEAIASPVLPAATEAPQAPAPPKPEDPPSSLTPAEIQQLLHVRSLMMVKGEQKMMEFLRSN